MNRLTVLTVYAKSSLAQIIACMSDPTALAYGTRDISSSFFGDCGHYLEVNLK